jgi:uroporphyrinogen decarboxylase
VDAAIIFADILLIAEPLGFNLEFAESGGPVIRNPFRQAEDLKRLREVDGAKDLAYVMETVRLVRSGLEPGVGLIGFAGAPFTLAAYLMEGGRSKDFLHTRALLAEDPGVWDELMKRLVSATVSYLNAQAAAGAQALQLFDTWVGILTPAEYQRFVLPYLKQLIGGLTPKIPVIYFGVHTDPFFPMLKQTGAQVIGVDWNVDLDKAWAKLGDVAVQGNLDPKVLLSDPGTVKKETEKVLRLARGKPGHIFNLGHGILPNTPMENVKAMIETVKSWKNQGA